MPIQETHYQAPSTSRTSNLGPIRNLDNEVCKLAIELMIEVWDNHILMEHLLADMKQVGRIITFVIEMKHGLINPTQVYPYFMRNIDDWVGVWNDNKISFLVNDLMWTLAYFHGPCYIPFYQWGQSMLPMLHITCVQICLIDSPCALLIT